MLALPTRMFSRRAAALVAIAALAWCQGGCRRKTRAPGKGPLALFPAETQLALGVDLARLRRAPISLRVARVRA